MKVDEKRIDERNKADLAGLLMMYTIATEEEEEDDE